MSDISDAAQACGEEKIDSKLVPVLREAIFTVQMVLYRELKKSMAARFPDWSEEKQGWLAGAVTNNLFAAEAVDKKVNEFARNNRDLVTDELKNISISCPDLLPFLTDALRMQVICDNQEGIHSIGSLLIAKSLGILQEERSLPMPTTFMLSVRNLAQKNNLVSPINPEAEDPDNDQ